MSIQDISTPQADKIRQAFHDFYKGKGHAEVANASLVPNVDSTLLFTNSGMFPLVNYLAGEKHPLGNRLVNFQRCVRTNEKDFAEIGDWKHTTMFEMMGNWSLGDYFKAEQIPQVLELYVDKFGLDPKRMYVSVFVGDSDAPRDEEAIKLWQESFARYGVKAELATVMFKTVDDKEVAYKIAENGEEVVVNDWSMDKYPDQRIFMYGKKENWWQRGEAVGELGGPDSEMFYNTGFPHDEEKWGVGHPNSDSPTYLEIGNSVFMQYKLNQELKWEELPQKNVDFGGGFVRVLMCLQGKNDVFDTELYTPILEQIAKVSGKAYKDGETETDNTKYFRIIADHAVAAVFILGDGVVPGRKDQGYILRRFIRRAVRMGLRLGVEENFLKEIAEIVIGIYQRHYSNLAENVEVILAELSREEERFRLTLAKGLKEFQRLQAEQTTITGKELFHIYETYGFPLELSLEELNLDAEHTKQVTAEYQQSEKEHRDLSRAGAEQKFTGGLADSSAQTTRLHTAHHLLLRALQTVLGDHVHQKGSNITAERLRIDFSNPDKLTPEQLNDVESIVNSQMQKALTVSRLEIPKSAAESLGAEMEFGQKYGDMVSVYVIGNQPEGYTVDPTQDILSQLNQYEIFSKEFCGGPHVGNTAELAEAGQFKILKQESVGSGIKRIKATLVK